MLKSIKLSLVAAAILTTAAATPVFAEGFLAGLARDAGIINEQQRRALDNAHAAAGRPLDHMANQAAGAAANYFVPGSGPAVTQGLEALDQYNRMPRPPGPAGQPGGYPQNAGGYPTAYQPMPQPQMGGACYTPVGVVRGPQFYGPIGTPCWFPTMYGPAQGQVGN